MWAGKITADRAIEEHGDLEAQEEDPWTSTCLWERFTIAWQGEGLVRSAVPTLHTVLFVWVGLTYLLGKSRPLRSCRAAMGRKVQSACNAHESFG